MRNNSILASGKLIDEIVFVLPFLIDKSSRRPAEVIDWRGKDFYFFRRQAQLIDDWNNPLLRLSVL